MSNSLDATASGLEKRFQQKKRDTRIQFKFEPECLAYSIEDRNGANSTKISYQSIEFDFGRFSERNDWLRNVGLIWCVIGVLQAAYAYYANGAIQFFWLLIGTGCLIAYRFLQTHYTDIRHDHGQIYVIRDDQHDAIVAEITQRRNQALLDIYGEVNAHNDPEAEARKFTWLKEQGVISESDYNKKIRSIGVSATEMADTPKALN